MNQNYFQKKVNAKVNLHPPLSPNIYIYISDNSFKRATTETVWHKEEYLKERSIVAIVEALDLRNSK